VFSTSTVMKFASCTASRHASVMLFIALAAASHCRAQPVALALSSGSAVAGSSVTLTLSLNSNSALPASVQWTLAYSTVDFSSPAITAGPSANSANKRLSCSNRAGSATCLLWGQNNATISSGVVATVTLPINHTTDSSSLLRLSGGFAADSRGATLGTSTTGGTVSIQPGLNGFACSPVTISAPATSSCTVTLTATASAGGAKIGFVASSASAVMLPASVTVPQGSLAATFSVTAGTVTTSTLTMLTASYLNVSQGFGITVNPSSSSESSSATFVKIDATTQGNWRGAYGNEGYVVVGDSTSDPTYVTPVPAGQSPYVWAPSTSDVRALQAPSNPANRIAGTWYANSFTVDLNIADNNTHQVAVYCLDWDSTARRQTVDILDGNGTVLNTQSLTSSFNGGVYLVWNVSGHVKIRVTRTGGDNAVLSGLFLH